MFQTLHPMFETQYNELALAVDLIAERIRALGVPAPGSYREFAKLSTIARGRGECPGDDMIAALVAGPGSRGAHRAGGLPGRGEAHDEPTADLLTQRMQVHEKTAWMLRSLLA